MQLYCILLAQCPPVRAASSPGREGLWGVQLLANPLSLQPLELIHLSRLRSAFDQDRFERDGNHLLCHNRIGILIQQDLAGISCHLQALRQVDGISNSGVIEQVAGAQP